MLDLTVLRSGLVDGVCVVLFEVGVVFASESSAPLRLFLSWEVVLSANVSTE